MHKNQYLIDMCILEGCTVLDDSCTECGTPEDWGREMTDKLEGRQLDAAVAERIFGRIWEPYEWWADYSTSMADAWVVAEWITSQGYHLVLSVDAESTNCEIWADDTEFPSYWTIVADVDAPLTQEAICHAALELKKRLEAEQAT